VAVFASSGRAAPPPRSATRPSSQALLVALCLTSAAAFAPVATPAQTSVLAAKGSQSQSFDEFDEMLVGVQAPANFFDPLGFVEKDGPEAFIRRRAVERKHGRVSMAAITGVIVHNAQIEFPGYLSKSENIKFSDIPDGFKGIFAVPKAGLFQILLFVGLIELAWWPANNYSGDYGCGFFGKSYEGAEKVKKLNAEMANGRLAQLGIMGALFAEGQTGQTLAQQFETLNFSVL